MSDLIHTYATKPHYQHHINHHTTNTPTQPWTPNTPHQQPVIVASITDARTLARHGHTNIVLVEHGAGQSYVLPDGRRVHAGVSAGPIPSVRYWLGPNAWGWDAVAPVLPNAVPMVVPSPHVLALRQYRERAAVKSAPHVVFALHWANRLVPESAGSWPWVDRVVRLVAREHPDWQIRVVAHPKLGAGVFRSKTAGRFDNVVVTRAWLNVSPYATVVVADNTSMMWEAAAVGIPVVGVRPPHWGTWHTLEHGLRFPGPNHIPLPYDHDTESDVAETVADLVDHPDMIADEWCRMVAHRVYGIAGTETGTTLDAAMHVIDRHV